MENISQASHRMLSTASPHKLQKDDSIRHEPEKSSQLSSTRNVKHKLQETSLDTDMQKLGLNEFKISDHQTNRGTCDVPKANPDEMNSLFDDSDGGD